MIEVGMEWQVIDTPIQLKEVSAPATPYANKLKLYAKDNGSGVSALYYKNDAGSEIGPLAAAVTDHGALTGLTDDDHTIYALLLGRSGGQTLIGGTASGNHLILRASSHATKGAIALGDSPVNLHPSVTAEYVQIKKTGGVGMLQLANTLTTTNTAMGEIDFGSTGLSATDKRVAAIVAHKRDALTTNPHGSISLYTADTANTLWERLRVHPTGYVTIGHGDSLVGGTLVGQVEVRPGGASTSGAAVYLAVGVGTSQFGNFQGRSARGLTSGLTASQADDILARYSGIGYGTDAWATSFRAAMNLTAGENWTNSAQGTYITFSTTPLLSTTAAERFRIGPSGQFGIGGATYGSAGSYFRSAGSSAAPVWSTLILPNSATANYIAYATSSNTLGESANLQFDGTDFILGSGIRARMSGQNRFRYLNSMAKTSAASDQSIAHDTFTAVAFANADEFDTDTIHDTSTNNSRMTVRLTGKYLCWAKVQFASNSTGRRGGCFAVNGTDSTTLMLGVPPSTGDAVVTFSDVYSLTAAQYVELKAFQDSGGALNLTSGFIGILYLGE